MTWIKLDDNAVDHPKIESLSDRAFRWWIKGLSYASRFLTDGILPPIFWKKVPSQSRSELTGQKLWDWHDPNFLIHDYEHHQSLKEDVEADKARNREKSKAYRDRRRSERRQNVTGNASPNVTGDVTVTRPLPVTRPENREQRTHTENREQRVEKRPPTLIARGEGVKWFQRHGSHVEGFCDWVCLAREQVDEFAGKIPGDDPVLKRGEVIVWAQHVRSQWVDRIVGDGSHFEFWRNRWTETHGGSRPANATLKAAQAAKSIDEAFR